MEKEYEKHQMESAALFLLLLLLPSAAPDIASDRGALILLRSAVGSPLLRWNESSSSPCSWNGVICSPDGSAVVELRLPAKGLSGKLPPHAFSNMTSLRTLSLRYNSLIGSLPAAIFESLASLHSLFLQQNSISGELPDSLFTLSRLTHLNLAGNKLSGPITASFNTLTRLQSLDLDHNNFSGPIPDLHLKNLAQFNVSHNKLTGRVPVALSGLPTSSFSGNSLCGLPLDPCNDGDAQIPSPNKDKNRNNGRTLEIIIGSVFGVLIIVLFIVCLCKGFRNRSPKPDDKGMTSLHNAEITAPAVGSARASASSSGTFRTTVSTDNTFIDIENNRLIFCGKVEYTFGLEELLGASAEVLGKGSHGMTYKAMVRMGPEMVVKRVKDVKMGAVEFKEQVEDVGKLAHENLLPLKAYFCNGTECLLVYEYMPMGSLNKLLHDNNGSAWSPLTWKSRMNIAHGAAKGILYLHLQGLQTTHGNIKSSNILLTPSYQSLVSDFGLAQLGGTVSMPIQPSIHCRPPEPTSQKRDIYSFGFVLLEILSGKMPSQECRNKMTTYGMTVAYDYFANDMFGTVDIEPQLREDVMKLIKLILACTAESPEDRPSMLQVSDEIEEIWSRSARYGIEEGQGVLTKTGST